jgi:hypothetical protein
MATLVVIELNPDFRIGQTMGAVEFFSMPCTAGGDPKADGLCRERRLRFLRSGGLLPERDADKLTIG